ncbi:MAG: hypothetical protein HWD59_11950 [Coxiellaceae bacterium]|nr:MAG: hypothetical protein HWD59_11950 [Coxiellaceae bacterium]
MPNLINSVVQELDNVAVLNGPEGFKKQNVLSSIAMELVLKAILDQNLQDQINKMNYLSGDDALVIKNNMAPRPSSNPLKIDDEANEKDPIEQNNTIKINAVQTALAKVVEEIVEAIAEHKVVVEEANQAIEYCTALEDVQNKAAVKTPAEEIKRLAMVIPSRNKEMYRGNRIKESEVKNYREDLPVKLDNARSEVARQQRRVSDHQELVSQKVSIYNTYALTLISLQTGGLSITFAAIDTRSLLSLVPKVMSRFNNMKNAEYEELQNYVSSSISVK